jgi:SOS response regulatory protein OraA/RecX
LRLRAFDRKGRKEIREDRKENQRRSRKLQLPGFFEELAQICAEIKQGQPGAPEAVL